MVMHDHALLGRWFCTYVIGVSMQQDGTPLLGLQLVLFLGGGFVDLFWCDLFHLRLLRRGSSALL